MKKACRIYVVIKFWATDVNFQLRVANYSKVRVITLSFSSTTFCCWALRGPSGYMIDVASVALRFVHINLAFFTTWNVFSVVSQVCNLAVPLKLLIIMLTWGHKILPSFTFMHSRLIAFKFIWIIGPLPAPCLDWAAAWGAFPYCWQLMRQWRCFINRLSIFFIKCSRNRIYTVFQKQDLILT